MRYVSTAAVALAFVLASLASPSIAAAQDAKLEIKGGDNMKAFLERQMGKRIGLVLTTGPEIAGVVTTVGDNLVHLSELSGREFFDAVVPLDKIAGVVVRVRNR
jgi:hypothetical protein